MPPKPGLGMFVLALVMFATGLVSWPESAPPTAEVRVAKRKVQLVALDTQSGNPLVHAGDRCGPYFRYVSPENDPGGTGFVVLTEQWKENTATFLVSLDKLNVPQMYLDQAPCLKDR